MDEQRDEQERKQSVVAVPSNSWHVHGGGLTRKGTE